MNLKSLEYFIEVAQDLNMTTAAQRLYISQQALSAQIQKLEQYYGVTLFERQPRLHLTFAGEELLDGAKKIMRENAEITKIDEWGKRRMAYEINKMHEGYYVFISFVAPQAFPAELDRVFKITDGILRSLIVNVDE